MKPSRLLPLAAALAALALPAGARLALLPENNAIQLHAPNISNLCTALAASPPGRCWRDPEIQEFLGHPELARWLPHRNAPAPAREEARHLLGEQIQLLQGEAALGLTQGTAPGFYLAAELTAPQYARLQELDRRINQLLPEAMALVRENFQGVELLRATRVSARHATNTTWQALVNDTLLHATDRAWVEKSISRLQARPPAGAAAAYLLHARVSGNGIRALIEKALAPRPRRPAAGAATNAPPLFQPGDLINALKISELQEVTLTIAEQDRQLRTAVRIHNHSCRQGIWTLLDPAPLPADWRLPYIPADAFAYSANRLNLAAFWEALPGMLSQINPTLAASQMMFQSMLQQAFGVDLSNDVIRHLESGYATCSRMEDGTSRTLVYWQVKQPAEAAAALGRLLADAAPLRMQLGARLQTAEFRGRTIYTITPAVAGSYAWSLAVGGQFLVCGDDAMVRAALRAADAPGAVVEFYSSAGYQALLRLKPAQACSYEILNLSDAIRAYLAGPQWRQIRRHCEQWNAKKQTRTGAGAMPNFDRMPPAEKIAAFFGPLLAYSITTADGWESITVWTEP